jgi:hypothetical protein
MLYLLTKLHTYVSSGLLVVTVKPKAKYGFRAAAILLFYILQKNILTKDDQLWGVPILLGKDTRGKSDEA